MQGTFGILLQKSGLRLYGRGGKLKILFKRK
jgi:hypothetical protein